MHQHVEMQVRLMLGIRTRAQGRSEIAAGRRPQSADETYYVALAFKRSDDNGDSAIRTKWGAQIKRRMARLAGQGERALRRHSVFSRTGDLTLGGFKDAVILKRLGEVDSGLLSTLFDRSLLL